MKMISSNKDVYATLFQNTTWMSRLAKAQAQAS